MTRLLRSFGVSLALHVFVIGGALALSVKTQGDSAAIGIAPVLSDPLLATLADADADPTRAAGIVGEKPGLADGAPDADPLAGQVEELEKLMKAQDEALSRPRPEPEPEPEPPPAPVPAEPATAVPAPVPAKPAEAVPAPAKPAETPKKAEPQKAAPKKADAPKKMSLEEFRRKNKQNASGNASKKKAPANAGKKGAPATVKVSKIDVSKIGVGAAGGGNGKTFGVAGGTGGNGGEGGRAVASAQQAYAAEVASNLARHLDDVLARSPLKLGAAVTVVVRLGIDASGNVRLLEVLGSNDAQVRERVSSAVARIGKFRAPPQNQPFEMRIPEVVLRPM